MILNTPHTSAFRLIRHGESEANAGLRTESPSSIPLTAKGRAQALALAKQFSAAPGLIVVSSFIRTQQTAQPLIARFPDVQVEVWPVHEFTYLNPELYRGTTETQRGVFAQDYWQRCDPHWNDGGGAESFADLISRIDDTLCRLQHEVRSDITIFTHGYFIKALLLRRRQPLAQVNAAFMAEFRDNRKNDTLPNTAVISLPSCGTAEDRR